MVLTYQDAVEAGARMVLFSDLWWEGADEDARSDVRSRRDAARGEARAVLGAVGYADLLTKTGATVALADYESACRNQARAEAEAENLRITVREDKRVMDRDAAEIERLREENEQLTGCWGSAAERANRASARADVTLAERDALAATVARVEALADDHHKHGSATGWHSQVHTVVKLADLRAALDPSMCPTCGAQGEQPCRYVAADSPELAGLTRVGAGDHPARRGLEGVR